MEVVYGLVVGFRNWIIEPLVDGWPGMLCRQGLEVNTGFGIVQRVHGIRLWWLKNVMNALGQQRCETFSLDAVRNERRSGGDQDTRVMAFLDGSVDGDDKLGPLGQDTSLIHDVPGNVFCQYLDPVRILLDDVIGVPEPVPQGGCGVFDGEGALL